MAKPISEPAHEPYKLPAAVPIGPNHLACVIKNLCDVDIMPGV